MSESQDACRVSKPTTGTQRRVVLRLVEDTLPDIGNLDVILKESEKVISHASLTEERIDEMIQKRAGLLERLQNTEATRDQRLEHVQDYDPFGDIDVGNYEGLVSAGVLDAENAVRLKKLDAVIDRLSSLDPPTIDSATELKKLSALRESFQKQLEERIKIRQQAVIDRRVEVRNKVLSHYLKRTGGLRAAIAEIDAQPKVLEKLKVLEAETREKRKKEMEQFVRMMNESVQVLSDRHAKVFKRLSELTGNENITEDLLNAFLKESAQRQRNIFTGVRNRLIGSVIDGEGKGQLKSSKEVVPWAEHSANISYVETVNGLRYFGNRKRLETMAAAGDVQAAQLLEECEQLINENEVLRRLIGKKHITDRETGKKCLGPFWAAFETRKANDETGVTEVRRKKRKEAAELEAKTKKAMADIIKQGGFAVTVPVYTSIRGKQQLSGKKKGAVRLERDKSKKGSEIWRVAEAAGGADILEVGSTSPLNMSSFPSWVREPAQKKFIMRGEDFVEFLVYESEE
ncbi:hypothetical protein JXD20_01115 [Candidatus Peregrinibacteria bacterium]|nr:hypothetical protein [Candidatus Peregrinibacteria bacterium]